MSPRPQPSPRKKERRPGRAAAHRERNIFVLPDHASPSSRLSLPPLAKPQPATDRGSLGECEEKDLAAVEEAEPVPGLGAEHGRQHGDPQQESALSVQPCKRPCHSIHLLRKLEPEILERLRGAPVEHSGAPVVTPALRQVALSDPGGGAVRA